jgi:hypothetical protein
MLRAKGAISRQQLETALQKQTEEGGKLGQWLVTLNYISEDEMVTCLAEQLKIPWIKDLDHIPNERASEALPGYLCKQFTLLPLEFLEKSRLVLAVDYSFENEIIQMIGDVLDCNVGLFLARSDALKDLIKERYGEKREGEVEVVPLGADLSLSVGHCFVEKWFDIGAKKARFGLFDDLLWIRYEKGGAFYDHLALLASDNKGEKNSLLEVQSINTQLSLFRQEADRPLESQ